MNSIVGAPAKGEFLGKSLVTGGPFLLNVVLLPPALNFIRFESSNPGRPNRDFFQEFRKLQGEAKEMSAHSCRTLFARSVEKLFCWFCTDLRTPNPSLAKMQGTWLCLALGGTLTGGLMAALAWLKI